LSLVIGVSRSPKFSILVKYYTYLVSLQVL
jgi:hypothetical protein